MYLRINNLVTTWYFMLMYKIEQNIIMEIKILMMEWILKNNENMTPNVSELNLMVKD